MSKNKIKSDQWILPQLPTKGYFDRQLIIKPAKVNKSIKYSVNSLLWMPINITINLAKIFAKILGRKRLLIHAFLHLISLITVNFLVYFAGVSWGKHLNSINNQYDKMSGPEQDTCCNNAFPDNCSSQNIMWQHSQELFFKAVPAIAIYISSTIFSEVINSIFTGKLRKKLQNKLFKKYYSNQTALALSRNQEMQVVTHTLENDISVLSLDGSYIISETLSVVLKGILSVIALARVSNPINLRLFSIPNADLLLMSLIYSFVTQSITNFITNKAIKLNIKIEKDKPLFDSLQMHNHAHINTITQRDGQRFIRTHHKSIMSYFRNLSDKAKLWEAIHSGWSKSQSIFDDFFKFTVIGYGLLFQKIVFDDRELVITSASSVKQLISHTTTHYYTINSLREYIQRINNFLEKSEIHEKKPSTVTYSFKEGKNLIINDFKLSIEDKLFLNIPNLLLQKGFRYLISGENGCGKSSLLSKINGINSDIATAYGEITYPMVNKCKPKIINFINDSYFIPNHSLLSTISFPGVPPQSGAEQTIFINKIKNLLIEIEICSKKSDINKIISQLENPTSKLSKALNSEQKKKIQIVSAIVHQPDILILDDAFANVEEKSIDIMQGMLKKYLPNAIILVVDPRSINDNKVIKNNFYTNHVQLTKQSVKNIRLFV